MINLSSLVEDVEEHYGSVDTKSSLFELIRNVVNEINNELASIQSDVCHIVDTGEM